MSKAGGRRAMASEGRGDTGDGGGGRREGGLVSLLGTIGTLYALLPTSSSIFDRVVFCSSVRVVRDIRVVRVVRGIRVIRARGL